MRTSCSKDGRTDRISSGQAPLRWFSVPVEIEGGLLVATAFYHRKQNGHLTGIDMAKQIGFRNYRKRQIVVQARRVSKPTPVNTIEGATIVVQPGDWVIRGAWNEEYPCKDGLFQQTYDPADPRDIRKRLPVQQSTLNIFCGA